LVTVVEISDPAIAGRGIELLDQGCPAAEVLLSSGPAGGRAPRGRRGPLPFDRSPQAYLVRLRLHRVRQALLAASHGTTTVSAVALDWGFWHFGEFSRAYRDCFGELPSDTLRSKPSAAERQ
jgi:hypothetical protein